MQPRSRADTFATGLRHHWWQLPEGAAACWIAAVFIGEIFMFEFFEANAIIVFQDLFFLFFFFLK